MLATRREPTTAELDATRRDLGAGRLTIERHIDALIAAPEFAERVAPLVILRHLLAEEALAAPSAAVLQQTAGPDPIYYLGDKPCAPAEAVRVRPWWDLDHEVKICRASYRPQQWMAERPRGEAPMDCLSELAPFQPDGGHPCGCGPNLIRCFESRAHSDRVVDSLHDELRGTVAWIAAHDLPAEQIFTANESWRDRNAELVRRVNLIELRREAHPEKLLRPLAAWPAAGQWAARDDLAPGQHAGVLTSPLLLYNLPDRRQRMSILYDPLWCIQPDSIGARPETVIAIRSGNLQFDGAGWRDLAARPLCTSCHARLDYGMQFFWGYPNGNLQAFFVPGAQLAGRGPLYVRDIDDPRGEAELNPQGFARLAVAQPEFRRCMARDFAAYVLGNELTGEQLDAIEAVARPGATSVRGLMRASLFALVDAWRTRPAEPPAPPSPAAPAADIAISPALRRQLEAHCLDCHDADPARVDLSRPALPRDTMVDMLADVGYGRMPANRPLSPADRRGFLELFVAAAWSGSDAETARAYYVGRMAALPAYRPEVVLDLVARRAGAHGASPWRMLEPFVRSDLQQVTPGMIGAAAAAAIEACHGAGRAATPDELARCLDAALGVDALAIDPRLAPRPAAQNHR
ncbi:MAG: hypothetical protein E6J90_23010 [Deltaproteobacteria bacterium]|nr:MAG: hypothetical protein E6J90_23010 [Deltaproteobacteria bacterium]